MPTQIASAAANGTPVSRRRPEDDDACDHRSGEVPEHVTVDGLGDISEHVAYADRPLRLHPIEDPANHPGRLEENEEGEDGDGGQGDHAAHHRPADGEGRLAETGNQVLELRRVPLDIAVEMQPPDEMTDLTLALLGLPHEAWQLLREVRGRAVHGVKKQVAGSDRHRRRDEEDDGGRRAPGNPAALDEGHGWMQERADEQRHEHQQDDDPQPPDQGQSDAGAHDDTGDDQRRPCDPEIVGAPPPGGIELLHRRLIGHRNQSTPCRLAEG